MIENGAPWFVPVMFVLVSTILYSFTINILFGHPTYWREKSRLLGFIPYFIRSKRPIHVHKFMPPVSKYQIMDLNDNVTIHVLTLSAADIIECSRIDKRWKSLCESEYLWDMKRKEVLIRFDFIKNYGENIINTKIMSGKYTFFFFCRQLYQEILKSGHHRLSSVETEILSDEEEWPNTCPVAVDGSIYELRTFLRFHPGGPMILLEWRSEDASRIFHLAAHSHKAKLLMEEFLLWSQKDVVGRKGWPKLAL
jgi:cytochrome b involved in lipid metabolism